MDKDSPLAQAARALVHAALTRLPSGPEHARDRQRWCAAPETVAVFTVNTRLVPSGTVARFVGRDTLKSCAFARKVRHV